MALGAVYATFEAKPHPRPSREAYGLLGRLHKDRREAGRSAGDARGLLCKAVAVYLKGFKAPWRDAYWRIDVGPRDPLARPDNAAF